MDLLDIFDFNGSFNMHQFTVMTEAPGGTMGLVKEIRVRWLLEELGEDYEELRFKHSDLKSEEYLKLQPFGQVPAYLDGDVEMFETGAILLYLADKYQRFLPTEGPARARALTWIFALMNSLEPYLISRIWIRFGFEQNEMTKKILDEGVAIISKRLGSFDKMMGNNQFALEEFSIVDIIFTTILRNLALSNLVAPYPKLDAYLERMQSREAFKKALSDHSKLYQL